MVNSVYSYTTLHGYLVIILCFSANRYNENCKILCQHIYYNFFLNLTKVDYIIKLIFQFTNIDSTDFYVLKYC